MRIIDRAIDGRHGPIPVRDYLPDVEMPGAAPFVWVHGGGFCSGGLDEAESHAVALAIAREGRQVTTVDYRLVGRFPLLRRRKPKASPHTYPVPVDDVVDAFEDATARHHDLRIALGGASAGACLAASAALELRDRVAQAPVGLALAYGIFHAELPPFPQHLRARLRGIYSFPQFTPGMTRRMTLNYAGSEKVFRDPTTFPGTAELHDLPPMLVLNADHDTLRSSGEVFAERARRAGGSVVDSCLPDTRHAFLSNPRKRAFDDGVREITRWLDQLDAG